MCVGTFSGVVLGGDRSTQELQGGLENDCDDTFIRKGLDETNNL